MFVTAIIAAGGRGERFSGALPKQLLSIGGRTVLERSVTTFLTHALVDDLVIALPRELAEHPPEYLATAAKPLRIVVGGARRQDSVAAAFRVVPDRSEIVVVHDAARPFASAGLIERTIAAAVESGAALAALAARDTVKQALRQTQGTGDTWVVRATLDRETIFLAQTPQAFRRSVLRDALALTDDATDEAALAEKAGHTVRIVDGEASNIKITTPDDLVIALAIGRSALYSGADRGTGAPAERDRGTGAPGLNDVRAGIGYDLHRLVEGRPFILGGITIPFECGLAGHSDADAVCHAVTDAILGASGAGDIGHHFPDTDPRWKGASSIDLLTRAVEIVREQGLEVGNVDATVIAERPKLAPYVDAMRANLARVLGVSIDRVSIKGKTNEGVGELGRGEAVAVHAIALLRSRTLNSEL
jgi:2-C-methyl-D-erythritol 4-phosphate cytidylyltransferase/2-C-methyl-D-erythritol 2,4-cyclodiphosphate synthase